LSRGNIDRRTISARYRSGPRGVLIKPKSWDRHGLKSWIEADKKRLHRNVLEARDLIRIGFDYGGSSYAVI
jgi:hypothetical protein